MVVVVVTTLVTTSSPSCVSVTTGSSGMVWTYTGSGTFDSDWNSLGSRMLRNDAVGESGTEMAAAAWIGTGEIIGAAGGGLAGTGAAMTGAGWRDGTAAGTLTLTMTSGW